MAHNRVGGQVAAGVAGVDRAAWLDQQQLGVGVGPWAVLDATLNDNQSPAWIVSRPRGILSSVGTSQLTTLSGRDRGSCR